jgi:hypothetical protein
VAGSGGAAFCYLRRKRRDASGSSAGSVEMAAAQHVKYAPMPLREAEAGDGWGTRSANGSRQQRQQPPEWDEDW